MTTEYKPDDTEIPISLAGEIVAAALGRRSRAQSEDADKLKRQAEELRQQAKRARERGE